MSNNISQLIINHKRRLQKLKEKYAKLGINTPPEVLIEIEDIEEQIRKLTSEQLMKERSDNFRVTDRFLFDTDSTEEYMGSKTTNTLSRNLRVFLCHSSNDKLIVRKLYDQMQKIGIELWFDEEKLLPGQDWNLEITKAIRKVDAVIVCISKNSISKAGYIQKEIKYALDIADEQPEGTIFIIPIKLEECEIPHRLSHLYHVNYFAENGLRQLKKALLLRAKNLGIL